MLQTGAPTYQAPAGGADAVLYQALDDERAELAEELKVKYAKSTDTTQRGKAVQRKTWRPTGWCSASRYCVP